MNERQNQMWDILCDLDGETVARLLTDYHGLQILDDGFYEHLIDEGYIGEPIGETDTDEIIHEADGFTDFCSEFPSCTGCPFEHDYSADCEDLFERAKEEMK